MLFLQLFALVCVRGAMTSTRKRPAAALAKRPAAIEIDIAEPLTAEPQAYTKRPAAALAKRPAAMIYVAEALTEPQVSTKFPRVSTSFRRKGNPLKAIIAKMLDLVGEKKVEEIKDMLTSYGNSIKVYSLCSGSEIQGF